MKTNNLYAQLSVGQGPAGPVGPQGPKGDKGDKGETGPVGPQGPKGDKGERGARGPQGNQGATGKQGPQGPVGLRGEKGDKGDKGDQGIQGIQGPKGDKGDTGPQGPKGERGEKGEKGDAGGALPEDKIDYLGNAHNTLRETMDSNVDFVLGEVNRVHYEGQHITAQDTLAGQAKNAVLEGQTLVNLHRKQEYRMRLSEETQQANKYENIVEEDNHISCNMVDGGTYGWGSYIDLGYINVDMLKPNTKYLVWFELATVPAKYSVSFMDKSSANSLGGAHNIPKGQNYAILTTTNEIVKSSQILYISFHQGDVGYYEFKNAMIIEYQEGMENWDISYFEGMASVKAPVLKSVGKNLFKLKTPDSTAGWGNVSFSLLEDGFSFQAKSGWNSVGFNVGYPNQQITVSATVLCSAISSNKLPNQKMGIGNVDYVIENRVNFVSGEEKRIKTTFNLGNTGTVWFYGSSDREGAEFKDEAVNWVIKDIQVELGSTSTTYEPYKSNILSAPEEVVLRSLPNGVCDTLNLNTREYTQRIGEYTYNGDNDAKCYVSNNNHGQPFFTIEVSSLGRKESADGISDTLPHQSIYSAEEQTKNGFCTNLGGNVAIRFYIDGLTTVEQYQNHFRNTPITIQYELATPIVKTVDLSDNHVYSYQDTTHYSFEPKDNSLIPTLSLDVPTKLNALVARQKDTIQELTQENESLKAAQQILLNSQLSFYETLMATVPSLMPTEEQVIIPDFIQDLYRLKNNQK